MWRPVSASENILDTRRLSTAWILAREVKIFCSAPPTMAILE
jgi:hypothetical protein